MIVFRLSRHDRTALDGTGGLYADGRWHRLGSRIVYAASTVSLALVEVRVHHQVAPLGWVSLEIDAASHLIEHLDLGTLPGGWQDDRSHADGWRSVARRTLFRHLGGSFRDCAKGEELPHQSPSPGRRSSSARRIESLSFRSASVSRTKPLDSRGNC